jgi:hypothetical protein
MHNGAVGAGSLRDSKIAPRSLRRPDLRQFLDARSARQRDQAYGSSCSVAYTTPTKFILNLKTIKALG